MIKEMLKLLICILIIWLGLGLTMYFVLGINYFYKMISPISIALLLLYLVGCLVALKQRIKGRDLNNDIRK
jgi:hypothetical protein